MSLLQVLYKQRMKNAVIIIDVRIIIGASAPKVLIDSLPVLMTSSAFSCHIAYTTIELLKAWRIIGNHSERDQ